MPEWAKARKVTEDEWNHYLIWLKNRYGWSDFLLKNNPNYFNEYQARGEVTIGAFTPSKETVTPPEEVAPATKVPVAETPPDEYLVYYGGTVWQRKSDGVFVDPDSLNELTPQELENRRQLYMRGYSESTGFNPNWATESAAELRAGGEAAFNKEQALWERQQREKEFSWQQLQAEKQVAQNYEEYRRALESGWRGPADWIKWWQLQQVPKTVMSEDELQHAMGKTSPPPAPSWLPNFVPSQVTGQTISKAPVVTPSGQQLAATPWSTREGLSGYAEWAGYRPWTDVLEHMAMMAPETPTGAGRYGWAPRKQRTYV